MVTSVSEKSGLVSSREVGRLYSRKVLSSILKVVCKRVSVILLVYLHVFEALSWSFFKDAL